MSFVRGRLENRNGGSGSHPLPPRPLASIHSYGFGHAMRGVKLGPEKHLANVLYDAEVELMLEETWIQPLAAQPGSFYGIVVRGGGVR